MALLFDDASSQYVETATVPVSAYPYAMSCWFYPDDGANVGVIMELVDKDVGADRQLMFFRGDISDRLQAYAEGAGSFPAESTTSANLSAWNHGLGLFVATTDRRVLLNGAGKGTASGVSAFPAADIYGFGRTGDSTPGSYFSGRIAECAVWDLSVWPGATSALKADGFEAKVGPALALGYSPKCFPLGLRSYAPLVRTANDQRLGVTLSGTAPSVANHARILYPFTLATITAPAAAVAADPDTANAALPTVRRRRREARYYRHPPR